MIIKKIACFILLFLASNFYCQDSIKKKSHNFLIEVGVSENVPLKGKYAYYSPEVKYYLTTGAFASFGYNFKLNKYFAFVPTLSYYYSQEKVKYPAFNGCYDSYYNKNGYFFESKIHSIALCTAVNFKYKRVYTESAIGISYIMVKQYRTMYSNETHFSGTNVYAPPIMLKAFINQKLGYELIKNRLDICLGTYMFIESLRKYNTPSINPTLSFRIKL